MKSGLTGLIVAGLMVAGMGAMAAENAAPKHDAAAKPHVRTQWRGVLSAPATNAAADVVAVLTAKVREGTKAYNLTCADAEVAAKIKDAAAKGATMVINGELNKEETAIAANKCTEPVKGAERPKGAHREKPAAPAGDAK
ncbi:MAG: hypothetical protein WCI17_08465 [bacterium]